MKREYERAIIMCYVFSNVNRVDDDALFATMLAGVGFDENYTNVMNCESVHFGRDVC
jgi:hypothetical protein